MGEMTVTVRCFSHVKDALGCDEATVTLPAGATAGDLIRRIRELGGHKLEGLPLRIAVNRTFVDDSAALGDRDEVALIPPVQGG